MQANRKGHISSSFGNFETRNPNVCSDSDLNKISSQLKKNRTSIYSKDYRAALKDARKNDFVFLDPPYVPDPKVKYTVKYQRHGIYSTTKKEDGWQLSDFEEVVSVFKELNKRGCKVMMTNYDSPFIRKHFSE